MIVPLTLEVQPFTPVTCRTMHGRRREAVKLIGARLYCIACAAVLKQGGLR